jgi:hypothetical protein
MHNNTPKVRNLKDHALGLLHGLNVALRHSANGIVKDLLHGVSDGHRDTKQTRERKQRKERQTEE